MLWKVVYPYEYVDASKRFSETSILTKKKFYSNLTRESITDADHKHAQKVWEDFELQNLGQHNDLYVQSDTLLLADIFKSFRSKCL